MNSIQLNTVTAVLLVIGAVGGWIAGLLHLPISWLLGSLVAGALVVILFPDQRYLRTYAFPDKFRTLFVALIGVMIGTQVTPDLLVLAGKLPWTIGGLVLFIVIAHFGNIFIFQKLGGYDRATAFYSGTTGGLMESLVMGESAGAVSKVLVAQQFLRIVVVITVLPFGLPLWLGAPVGSAAGLSLNAPDAPPVNLPHIIAIVAAGFGGLWLARKLRFPAAQLTGPLLISASVTATGLIDLHLPMWLVACAQVVIGVSLGLRFKGMQGQMLGKSLALSLVSVSWMLGLGAVFALILERLTGFEILHLLISFAPGGVAEMSVIALSLNANPALVSLHHIARIVLTIIELTIVARLMGLGTTQDKR